MITKSFIEHKVREEISEEKFQRATMHFLDAYFKSERSQNFLTVYEISTMTDEKLNDADIMRLAFMLASLSLPLLELFIQFEEEYLDQDEIMAVLLKQPIGHPISGEELSYEEYKHEIELFFKFNEQLWLALHNSK